MGLLGGFGGPLAQAGDQEYPGGHQACWEWGYRRPITRAESNCWRSWRNGESREWWRPVTLTWWRWPEDGYGWEKLFSERMCRHFREDYKLETRIVRYHNVYGPNGTYDGGREKAPAAI